MSRFCHGDRLTKQYVQEKAHQALVATRGDAAAAQQLLVAWAVRDQTLLLGLAKAHLKALATVALEEAAQTIMSPQNRGTVPPEILNRLINQAGLRQQAAAQETPPGHGVHDPVRQAETWQTIAKSFKKKT